MGSEDSTRTSGNTSDIDTDVVTEAEVEMGDDVKIHDVSIEEVEEEEGTLKNNTEVEVKETPVDVSTKGVDCTKDSIEVEDKGCRVSEDCRATGSKSIEIEKDKKVEDETEERND